MRFISANQCLMNAVGFEFFFPRSLWIHFCESICRSSSAFSMPRDLSFFRRGISYYTPAWMLPLRVEYKTFQISCAIVKGWWFNQRNQSYHFKNYIFRFDTSRASDSPTLLLLLIQSPHARINGTLLARVYNFGFDLCSMFDFVWWYINICLCMKEVVSYLIFMRDGNYRREF